MRRADPGADRLRECSAGFECGIAAHRCHHGLRADFPGAENAHHVAPQPFAILIGDQRPVRVAIRCENGVKAVLSGPGPALVTVLFAHRLRIDGNERIAAAQPDGLRTQRLQDRVKQVARGGGVLIDAELHALETAAAEGVGVAPHIAFQNRWVGCGQGRGGRRRELHRRCQHPLFVFLADLAVRQVKFDAISVEGNVASRHHDGRRAARLRCEGQAGCWQHSAVDGLEPLAQRFLPAGARNLRAARAKVVADQHWTALRSAQREKGVHIGPADVWREIAHQPPHAAGAEAHTGAFRKGRERFLVRCCLNFSHRHRHSG